jgi:hypothetical protein
MQKIAPNSMNMLRIPSDFKKTNYVQMNKYADKSNHPCRMLIRGRSTFFLIQHEENVTLLFLKI